MPVWRLVGKTLERVEVRSKDSSHWAATLDCLKTHCKHLVDIALHKPADDNEFTDDDFADFLVSYGAQLQRIELSQINTGACARLVESCPNVRVTYRGCNSDIPSISTLGDHLDVLSLTLEPTGNWDARETP